MKKVIPLLLLMLTLDCSKCNNNLAGTVTDTNSGSITGKVLSEGANFKDTVKVLLFSGSKILAKTGMVSGKSLDSMVTNSGLYTFDSLSEGNYSIRVVKDGLVLKDTLDVKLAKAEKKTVDITIVIIINQMFNITNINNNQNVTINNFYFVGSSGNLIHTSDGNYSVTFAVSDTVRMKAEIAVEGKKETINIIYVKLLDGSYVSLPIQTNLPIAFEDGATIVLKGTGSDSVSAEIKGRILEDTR
jgi:hypothetical protein